MTNYAEFHCHSAYSFLDGASLVEELVKEACRLNLYAVGLTDHNGLYGAVKFSQAAARLGLKTIYGAELTLNATGPRTNCFDPDGEHLVVLANNPKGYHDLCSLISFGQLKGQKSHPIFNLETMSKFYTGNWLILTGCRKGPVIRALFNEGPTSGLKQALKLVEIFGKDNVLIELSNNGNPLDSYTNDVLCQIAIKANLNFVATGNVHYATLKERYAANVLACIRANKTLEEMNPFLSVNGSQHLKGADEQLKRFSRWPGAVEITTDIAKDIAFDLTLIAPELPDFITPEKMSQDDYLRSIVLKKAESKYGNNPKAFSQIKHELGIIKQLGFAGYFLIIWDIVNFCKNSNIYCQGRGSAANSAVCYVLDITRVDAVGLNLLFERFLSPSRCGPPDIDLDIESDKREAVIQYVYNKYGRNYAGQVANVIEYKMRSAIRDVARVFGYNQNQINTWAKKIKGRKYDYGNLALPIPPKVLELAAQITGLPRHLGIHSGGIVITKTPVSGICPVEWATRENRSVLQWDKDDCAAAGLVKFDLLGLRMLSALHNCVDLIKQTDQIELDLSSIEQESEVYDMLCDSDSLGVFQVESRAQMNTLPRLRPRCFYDLVIEVALIRPGPIQSQSVHPYLRRRENLEPVTYLHPLLKPALEKTLGVPIFQEQLMRIAIDAASFNAFEADELRTAMSSKRSKERMEQIKEKVISGLKKNSINDSCAEEIFNCLKAFSNFGFPESHAISFAYLTYASAWLKLHYPAAFYVSLLNSQPMGFWSPASLVSDARRHNITVLAPDVNISHTKTSLIDTNKGPIILGLNVIKGLSLKKAGLISKLKPYKSMEDLVIKTNLNQSDLEFLAKADALRSLGQNRRTALWKARHAAQATYRLSSDNYPVLNPQIPILKEESKQDSVLFDVKATGIWLRTHILELKRKELSSLGILSAGQIKSKDPGEKVKVAGIVTHRQKPETAKGAVFLNLEDETGLINVTFSKGAWKRWAPIAGDFNILIISGTLQRYDKSANIQAEKVSRLEI
jgi:error-prone DNA polymerase